MRKNQEPYNIGLDIGTSSIGWSIMNDNFDYAMPHDYYFNCCKVGYNDFNFDDSYLKEALDYTSNKIKTKEITRNLYL